MTRWAPRPIPISLSLLGSLYVVLHLKTPTHWSDDAVSQPHLLTEHQLRKRRKLDPDVPRKSQKAITLQILVPIPLLILLSASSTSRVAISVIVRDSTRKLKSISLPI